MTRVPGPEQPLSGGRWCLTPGPALRYNQQSAVVTGRGLVLWCVPEQILIYNKEPIEGRSVWSWSRDTADGDPDQTRRHPRDVRTGRFTRVSSV